MRYEELEKVAREGRLTVSKTLYRTWKRFAKYPSNKLVNYRIFTYSAKIDGMDENSFYKIKRGDLKRLIEAGAKIGEMHPN